MQIITKKGMFVTTYVTGSTSKTERQKPGFINKKHNKTTLFSLAIKDQLILLFQTDTDISGSRFKFDRGKAF